MIIQRGTTLDPWAVFWVAVAPFIEQRPSRYVPHEHGDALLFTGTRDLACVALLSV